VATPAVHRGHPLKPNYPACGDPDAELFTNNKTQVTCTLCRAKTDHDPKDDRVSGMVGDPYSYTIGMAR
jgi:hypothetical protein